MKKTAVLSTLFCLVLVCVGCTGSGSKVLFDGAMNDLWMLSDAAKVEQGSLLLQGDGAVALLRQGSYRDFDLTLELRTTPGGKGFIGIHTDSTGKGYRIAVNNDPTDPVWWRMTGSLTSVRNLTKSFIRENEWFTMNIRVLGRAVTVTIDDEPVVEYIEPAEPYRTVENAKSVLGAGRFALVSEGLGAIEFRHISVKALDMKEADRVAQLAYALDEQRDAIIRLHQEDFPVLDYHVHLKGGLTKEAAAIQSRRLGINYAVAPNCGIGFPITNDREVLGFLDSMRSQPFILSMQAEGREWTSTFSQQVRDEFDFVFTDALTFHDHKNRRTRLWVNEEVFIDISEEKYMDMLVERMCAVLQEPFDIYVNPFFLPEQMNDRYDEFWTEKRVGRVVDMLAKTGKALEINELYRIPSQTILLRAKEAGVKFSFGSNNITPDVSRLEYSVEMKAACGLTAADMYKPRVKI
ncbi:DUF1080 domain-containing protein [uncultured Alistipes sp.]|uniref:DUF1080 domain-containing protein n=1 Tax=uncultured Alistipes sp. TaxID=538949 RepID=UPI0025D1E549|nr:DUF1080 domain-containing protein [uncultured Alistipes sp.]